MKMLGNFDHTHLKSTTRGPQTHCANIKIPFKNHCNIRFCVEFFVLAGLESQNLQYSAIFGMPLQLEGALTFRESTIVRVFPLSSPLGLDGLSKSVKSLA